MSYELHSLLDTVCQIGASGLYLTVDSSPFMRLNGQVRVIEGPALTPQDTINFMNAITPPEKYDAIKNLGGADFAFSFLDKARFRVSVFKAKGRMGIIFRWIPNKIYPLDQIGLPPVVKQLLSHKKGIIFITGPTSSGKTTTMASMIHWINEHYPYHILTIEDPIEFYHTHSKSMVTQREVGTDVASFSEAVIRGLRQDPNVIMVGEMRDRETMEAAVTAAETGHLVLASLHTIGTANTMNRILNSFPSEDRDQVRTQLASSTLGVISQILCNTTKNSMIPAFEVMVNTPGIASLIRDNKTYRIQSEIQTGVRLGMVTMNAYLEKLHAEGHISQEEMTLKSLTIGKETNV